MHNGNLPPGIHECSLQEVAARYGGPSLTRKNRTQALAELINLVRNFSLGVFIDGGYVTSKTDPKDVDLIVVVPQGFKADTREKQEFLRLSNLGWRATGLDIFAPEDGGLEFRFFFGLFTHDKHTGDEKGILYIRNAND